MADGSFYERVRRRRRTDAVERSGRHLTRLREPRMDLNPFTRVCAEAQRQLLKLQQSETRVAVQEVPTQAPAVLRTIPRIGRISPIRPMAWIPRLPWRAELRAGQVSRQ